MRAASTGAGERGTTLIEALVALLVLAFGMASVARLQTHLRLHADIGRQRGEAVRLAQEDVEGMRAFAVAAASAGARAWADIASAARTVDVTSGLPLDTTFRITRAVAPDVAGSAAHATVTVAWDDRRGDEQRVVLEAIIAGHDPAHAASLAIAPAGRQVRGALGRAAPIPLTARDLGDGRSAWSPAPGMALVFDNATGLVRGRCADASASRAAITMADLASCDTHTGQLLAGIVRFALGAAPDPNLARDAPLDLSVSVATTGGPYPLAPACSSEARKTVRISDASGTRDIAVPLQAVPADLGLASWSDTGDRYLAYACVVYPRADGAWSGRATIVPAGWSIGSGSTERRVCRYAADRDASGRVDANDEHPLDYTDVRAALVNQNFLVVAGNESCPSASPVHVAGSTTDVFIDASTVEHQP